MRNRDDQLCLWTQKFLKLRKVGTKSVFKAQLQKNRWLLTRAAFRCWSRNWAVPRSCVIAGTEQRRGNHKQRCRRARGHQDIVGRHATFGGDKLAQRPIPLMVSVTTEAACARSRSRSLRASAKELSVRVEPRCHSRAARGFDLKMRTYFMVGLFGKEGLRRLRRRSDFSARQDRSKNRFFPFCLQRFLQKECAHCRQCGQKIARLLPAHGHRDRKAERGRARDRASIRQTAERGNHINTAAHRRQIAHKRSQRAAIAAFAQHPQQRSYLIWIIYRQRGIQHAQCIGNAVAFSRPLKTVSSAATVRHKVAAAPGLFVANQALYDVVCLTILFLQTGQQNAAQRLSLTSVSLKS